MEGAVSEKTCDICRGSTQRQFEEDWRRLNAHSESLAELTKVTTTLTEVSKQNSDLLKQNTVMIQGMDGRLGNVEKAQLEVAATRSAEKSKRSEGFQAFMQTKTFDWLVKAIIVLFGMIILAAIGKDVDWTKLIGLGK